MSGFKWSDLADELRSARKKVEQKVRNFVDGVQASINHGRAVANARQESRRQFSNLERKLEKERRRQREMTDRMEGEIKKMAERHQASMDEQRLAFLEAQQQQREDLLSKVKSLKDWTSDQLTAFDSKFETISKNHSLKISQLENDVQYLFEQESDREKRATDLIKGMEVMIEEFGNKSAIQKFAPNAIEEDIIPVLEQAIVNFEAGDFQAALARGQDSFIQLTRIDRQVLRQQVEFDRLFDLAFDALQTFLEMVRQNRQIELDEKGYLVELDYWTKGAYSQLESKGEELQKVLETKRTNSAFKSDQLQEILSNLKELEDERLNLIKVGIEKVYASHRRAQLADLIVKALGPGFRVVEGGRGFEGQDQRSAYLIKFQHVDQTEIVAMISPNEDTSKNSLSINTYKDSYRGEKAKQERWEGLQKSLKKYGIEFTTTRSNSDEEGLSGLYHVENLIKEGNKIPASVIEKARSL